MNPAAHQVARRIINHAMAGHGIFPGKGGGNDFQLEMAAALTGAGMAGMTLRVVMNGDRFGMEDGQALAQQFDGFGAHAGRAFLNGLMLTFS